MTKIVFFGTSSFSATILESLFFDKRFSVSAVVTTLDKPVGRKQLMQESAVAQLANALELPLHKMVSVRSIEAEEILKAYNAEFFVVAAYGKIIPKNILDIPSLGSINVHASLLPAYRGAAPIQGALLNGEQKTGITIMRMDEEIDHGQIYAQHLLDIEADECEPQLETKLAALSATNIGDDLEKIKNGTLVATDQDHSKATFTKIITKEDGHINWNKSASEIFNQFRAYYEWPGIFSLYDGKRIKITDCQPGEIVLNENKKAGTIFSEENKIYVACGVGALQLLLIQPEGKHPMLPQEFINGHKDFLNSHFE